MFHLIPRQDTYGINLQDELDFKKKFKCQMLILLSCLIIFQTQISLTFTDFFYIFLNHETLEVTQRGVASTKYIF
jgi:hypothetical protein